MPPSRKSTEIKYASFSYRMLASVIDSILIIILLTPVIKLLANALDVEKTGQMYLPSSSDFDIKEMIIIMQKNLLENMPALLLEMSVVSIIFIAFWIAKGGTPGKMLLKMKIVDAKTLKKPGSKQSVVRYLGYFASVVPFLLGFVWIYFDKRKQGFHDKIARTVVIIDKSGKKGGKDTES